MEIHVQLGKTTYRIVGDSRYATVYWRYSVPEGLAWYDTPEEAASSLNYGQEYGEMSPTGIYDMKDRCWIAQDVDKNEAGFCDGLDWKRAVALEVPVRVVESRVAE